jgi:hypothetical protein
MSSYYNVYMWLIFLSVGYCLLLAICVAPLYNSKGRNNLFIEQLLNDFIASLELNKAFSSF